MANNGSESRSPEASPRKSWDKSAPSKRAGTPSVSEGHRGLECGDTGTTGFKRNLEKWAGP